MPRTKQINRGSPQRIPRKSLDSTGVRRFSVSTQPETCSQGNHPIAMHSAPPYIHFCEAEVVTQQGEQNLSVRPLPSRTDDSGYLLHSQARIPISEEAFIPFPIQPMKVNGANDLLCLKLYDKRRLWHPKHTRETKGMSRESRDEIKFALEGFKKIGILLNERVGRSRDRTWAPFRCFRGGAECTHEVFSHGMCPTQIAGFVDCLEEIEEFYFVLPVHMTRQNRTAKGVAMREWSDDRDGFLRLFGGLQYSYVDLHEDGEWQEDEDMEVDEEPEADVEMEQDEDQEVKEEEEEDSDMTEGSNDTEDSNKTEVSDETEEGDEVEEDALCTEDCRASCDCTFLPAEVRTSVDDLFVPLMEAQRILAEPIPPQSIADGAFAYKLFRSSQQRRETVEFKVIVQDVFYEEGNDQDEEEGEE